VICVVPPYASKDTDEYTFIFVSITIPHGITAHKPIFFETELLIYLFICSLLNGVVSYSKYSQHKMIVS